MLFLIAPVNSYEIELFFLAFPMGFNRQNRAATKKLDKSKKAHPDPVSIKHNNPESIISDNHS